MQTVKDILQDKGYHTRWSFISIATVYSALELMDEINVGALTLIDEGELFGEISERDCTRKLILQGKPASDTSVSEIMTSNVYFVTPETGIEKCTMLMSENKIRPLPVLDDGGLAGIISIGNIMRFVLYSNARRKASRPYHTCKR